MSTVPMSRKKIDSEIMYSLRRQGFTNKQIAKQLDVCVATVYNTIGRMAEAVKHAEVQNKPPVVDVPVVGKPVSKPVISENNGFKAVDVKPKEVQAPPCEGHASDHPERKIHYAGRALPVCYRHQRQNGRNAGRAQHGVWCA